MGSLSGSNSVNSAGSVFNLTTPAQTDWIVYPQVTTPTRKSGAGSTIGAATTIGAVTFATFNYGNSAFTWTGGTPTASGTAVLGGIYTNPTSASAVGQGIQFTLPADTTSRTVVIYWGANSCAPQLVATLSDGSATALTLTPTATGANIDVYYSATITYAANSAGQTLTIAATVKTLQSGGNIFIGAAKYLASASSATGSAASTQAANTTNGAGGVSVSGSAASSQSNATSAAGGVLVSSAAASAQAANNASASGSVSASGAAASTQAQNTTSVAGGALVSGSAASTQAANTSSAAGAVTLSGAIVGNQAPNVNAATGAIALTGAASATQSPNTATASGSNGSTESLNGTTIPDNATQIIDASAAVWTLTADGHAARNGVNQATGSASPYILLLYWDHFVYGYTGSQWRKNTAPWTVTTDPRPAALVGAGSATQAQNTTSAVGGALVSGAAAAQQVSTASASGSVALRGSAASLQGRNVGAAIGDPVIGGIAASVQMPGSATAAGMIGVAGSAYTIQAANIGEATGGVLVPPAITGAAASVQALNIGEARGASILPPVIWTVPVEKRVEDVPFQQYIFIVPAERRVETI
jgi:hypothetical protein